MKTTTAAQPPPRSVAEPVDLPVESPEDADAPSIFVCAAHADRRVCRRLVELLSFEFFETDEAAKRGIRCSAVPGYGLRTNEPINSQILRDLTGARVVVAVISPMAMRSTYVWAEHGVMWAQGGRAPHLFLCRNERPADIPLAVFRRDDQRYWQAQDDDAVEDLLGSITRDGGLTRCPRAPSDSAQQGRARRIRRLVRAAARVRRPVPTWVVAVLAGVAGVVAGIVLAEAVTWHPDGATPDTAAASLSDPARGRDAGRGAVRDGPGSTRGADRTVRRPSHRQTRSRDNRSRKSPLPKFYCNSQHILSMTEGESAYREGGPCKKFARVAIPLRRGSPPVGNNEDYYNFDFKEGRDLRVYCRCTTTKEETPQ